MNQHEARLANMIDPDKGRAWDLNDEDRQAVRWAFARIKTLEDDLARSRQDQIVYFKESAAKREKYTEIARLIGQL